MNCFTKQMFSRLICLCILLCTIYAGSRAQNFDIDWLRKINPQYPSSQVWKTVSSTAEPLAISIPIGMAAVSLLTENKKLEYNAYETGASVLIAIAATGGLKYIINRPRPYETYPNDIHPDTYDYGHSFPSAHVSMVFSSATSVFLNSMYAINN